MLLLLGGMSTAVSANVSFFIGTTHDYQRLQHDEAQKQRDWEERQADKRYQEAQKQRDWEEWLDDKRVKEAQKKREWEEKRAGARKEWLEKLVSQTVSIG